MILLHNVLYNFKHEIICTACNFCLKTVAFKFAYLKNICLID